MRKSKKKIYKKIHKDLYKESEKAWENEIWYHYLRKEDFVDIFRKGYVAASMKSLAAEREKIKANLRGLK